MDRPRSRRLPGSLRRIVAKLAPVAYRRWGQRSVADPAEVAVRRERSKIIQSIAEALGCSRTAVRAALESTSGTLSTRHPLLSSKRTPTDAELLELRRLHEACSAALHNRPGCRDNEGEAGRAGESLPRVAGALPGARPRTDVGPLDARPARPPAARACGSQHDPADCEPSLGLSVSGHGRLPGDGQIVARWRT